MKLAYVLGAWWCTTALAVVVAPLDSKVRVSSDVKAFSFVGVDGHSSLTTTKIKDPADKRTSPGVVHRFGFMSGDKAWLWIGGCAAGVALIGVCAFAASSGSSGVIAKAPPPSRFCLLVSRYSVPREKMEAFQELYTKFYDEAKPQEDGLLFFGFVENAASSVVICRSAHENAAGVKAHLDKIQGGCEAASQIASFQGHEVYAPLDDVQSLQESLGSTCQFFVSDQGTKMHQAQAPNYSKTICDRTCVSTVRYDVVEGKMADFQQLFEQFYNSIKEKEDGLLWHGFAVNEEANAVVCYEAHKTAEGFLEYLQGIEEPLQEARQLAKATRKEIYAPSQDLGSLRASLPGSSFFEFDERAKSWIQEPSDTNIEETDIQQLVQESVMRLAGSKAEKIKEMCEERLNTLPDKSKDFVMAEMNALAEALTKAMNSDDAEMMLDFNEALEASFPRVPLLVAGILSPAILTIESVTHTLQLAVLFLPLFIGSALSLWEDWGETCGIPGLEAWIWTAFVLSLLLTLGHGSLASQVSSGRAALAAKNAEIHARLQHNAADGETSIADMQEIVIGGTVIIQEAILLEDAVRKNMWSNVVGICTFLWIFVAMWNFILVVGWTFVPTTIAFHEKAKDVAGDDYCGMWASVLTARIVCLLTPFFFFMNLIMVLKWALTCTIHWPAVAKALISFSKDFDTNHCAGVPTVEFLIKGFILRASTDIVPARLTIALGEALRLSHERDELEDKLHGLKQRIRCARAGRRGLKTLARDVGSDLYQSMVKLEEAGEKDMNEWKEKGEQIVKECEKRALESKEVTTEELEKLVQRIQDLAQEAKDSEMGQTVIAKVKEAQEAAAAAAAAAKDAAEAGVAYAQSDELAAKMAEAQAAAASGVAQAQSAAASAAAEAQSGIQAGVAYAQSDEVAQMMAQAQTAAAAQAAQAQSGLQAGVQQAQSAAAQGAAQAQAAAQQGVAQAQAAAQQGVAQAQDAAQRGAEQAQAGLAQAQGAATQMAQQGAASAAQMAQQGQEAAASAAAQAKGAAKGAADKATAAAKDAAGKGGRGKGKR